MIFCFVIFKYIFLAKVYASLFCELVSNFETSALLLQLDMVLSKKHLLEKLKSKDIVIDPMIDGFQLQPHSIDMRLGYDFHIPMTWELTREGRRAINIDPFSPNLERNFEKISLKPGQYFELLPKEYIVGTTLEKIELNAEDLMGVLYPRSSINRRGLAVDLSGIIDVGYSGRLMIPIVNNTHEQIIRIYPGERICQVVIQQISSKISKPEAMQHGLNANKYNGANTGFQTEKADKSEEIALIQEGNIEKLKEKYQIKLD